jgi:glycosyltransferase involved in cell wall biosynthesis
VDNTNVRNERVSIALATYNGEKYLPALLASLQKQTIKPFELIVLDDSSTDDSLRIINNYPFLFEKKVFSNNKNQGPIYTFKKLAGLCSGEYIAFCDQDDIWNKDKLELGIDRIKELPGEIPGIVFSDLKVIDEEGKVTSNSFWKVMNIKPHVFSFKDVLFDNIITGCTTMINKAMAREVLKMPDNIMMHDHWMALIAYSFGNYSIINAPTVLFRVHNSNVTKKNRRSHLKVFFEDLKMQQDYLKRNFVQAIQFRELYVSKLRARDLKEIEKFVSLYKKPFLVKRWVKYLVSLGRWLNSKKAVDSGTIK